MNKDTGETQRTTIPFGSYQLKVVKEGYHSRPVTFAYKGKELRLNSVVIVETTKPLPEVAKTKRDKDRTRTTGSGTSPKR